MAVKVKKPDTSVCPIYVISGKDNYLVSTECESLLNKLLTPDQRTMCLYQTDGKDANITDVLDELRTLPFLAKSRVVLIKEADKFISENRPAFEKYFESPSPSGVLILVVSTWLKTTRLAKMLPKAGTLLAIDEIKSAQLPQYAVSYARTKFQKNINRSAAGLLVELAGDDPGRIASEIDKLAIYVGDANKITTDDVEKLIGHNRMFNVFAVIEAVTAGSIGVALGRLRNMFITDKDARFTAVGAFAFHFRRMLNAKVLLEKGMDNYQISGKLRIWGNKEAFFAQLRRFSLERIAGFLSELARMDYAIKTGQKTPESALEILVMKMAS
ncbi:MAG: DNA polymerase III subunit delta [Sedimentisphaerales bacterium]|nr:DNA polymerase III subunit delta [Sedimentisphaerales bacterium]